MVFPAVTLVEGAGVLAVEVAHPLGQVPERRLDDEVVVVTEETASVQAPAVPPADPLQDPDEDPPVGIVEEDRRPAVPFGTDVVASAGLVVAERSSHAATVAAAGALRCLCASLDTSVTETTRARHGDTAAGATALVDGAKRDVCLGGDF
ncbi:MAG TPA: hypothetical protein VIR59_01415 [Gaiellaceae bacterium]